MVGCRAISNGELSFESCRVPKENLIGRLNKGFLDMMVLYDVIRLYLAIGGVGVAQAALDASMKFAQERKAFGKPIGDFQMIRAMIVDMATEIDAARLLTYRALDMEERGLHHTKETSMAKLYASEASSKVTDMAVQIHGGYGYSKSYPVERYYRDARVTRIYEGTSEVHRMVIARGLMG